MTHENILFPMMTVESIYVFSWSSLISHDTYVIILRNLMHGKPTVLFSFIVILTNKKMPLCKYESEKNKK